MLDLKSYMSVHNIPQALNIPKLIKLRVSLRVFVFLRVNIRGKRQLYTTIFTYSPPLYCIVVESD